MNITFAIATTDTQFKSAKKLFEQYAASLGVDLEFQNFSEELKSINIQYNKPKGALLLAQKDDAAIGCVALRQLNEHTAELKRMYVLPEFRKYSIGKKLLERSIEIAHELNYNKIQLDTLPTMSEAQNLYRKFGFYEIPPYRFNPVKGTVFMEKELDKVKGGIR